MSMLSAGGLQELDISNGKCNIFMQSNVTLVQLTYGQCIEKIRTQIREMDYRQW